MDTTTEAQISLLIYVGIGMISVITGSWLLYLRWKRQRENRIFDRKEIILDQYLLRLKEFSLLIEETWQKKNPK